MGHYRGNVRDLEFNLFEVFRTDRRLGSPPYADLDEVTVRGLLDEVRRLAEGPLADAFVDGDRHPPVFDATTSTVTVPDSLRRSFRALMDGEWWRLDLPQHLGGTGAPPTVRWAVSEMLLGANPAAFLYMSGP